MSDDWTKDFYENSTKPDSENKKERKQLSEEELKAEIEFAPKNEQDVVESSVFKRVAQKAMQENQKTTTSHKETQGGSGAPKERPAAKPAGQPTAAQERPAAKPAAQPTAAQERPAVKPAGQPTAAQERPAVKPAGQPTAAQERPAAKPAGQPTAAQERPAVKPEGQPTAAQERPAAKPAAQPTTPEAVVYSTDEETDAMETAYLPEEEQEEKGARNLLRNILIGGIAVVAVVIVVFLILSSSLLGKDPAKKPVDNSPTSSAEIFTGKSLTGVILSLDVENEKATVYTAADGQEKEFTLSGVELITDSYGNKIGFSSLKVGQVVDVSYKEGSTSQVERFRLSSGADEIKNAFGVKITAGERQIRINGKTYQYDDHLICTYGGQPLDPSEITEQYVINGWAVDGHLYTVYVMQAVGTVTLANSANYEGAEITFTPTYGEPLKVKIEKSMKPIVLTEGFNKYKVEKEGSTLASGTLFVEASVRQELELPAISEGMAVVDVNILPEGVHAAVKLDGKEQDKTTLSVSYGKHELEISAEGYKTVTQTIDVSQPYMQVTVELEATELTVSVTAAMTGVAVYCDGEYMGTYNGSAVEFKLPYGFYVLALGKSGYETIVYSLTLEDGMPSKVDLYFSDFTPAQDSSEEESSYPDSSKEDSSREDSSAGESSREESSAEESSKEESSAEESSMEESSAEESSAEESSAEESSMEESSIEESSIEESSVEESLTPDSSVEANSMVDENSAASGETSANEDSIV